ncbi:diguanylate cyclase [Mesorhizobium sp. ANAO-SY3R2]|uniref:GGDEF domain-containing protein n=1 Tax=Mesorhizobium sp. ANAO-SY3R2 TaxID=3166644 RepID=UPI00366B4085
MRSAIERYPDQVSLARKLVFALIVAGAVFAASLLGILTRPIGFLAAVWPANAVLLGLMVRNPAYATTLGWLGAFAGFFVADFVTGSDMPTTIWLTAANIAGAATGYVLFRLMPEQDRRLRRPVSVLYLFAAACGASMASAVVGRAASHLLFGKDFFDGLAFWSVSELVNHLIVLPMVLTFPGVKALLRQGKVQAGVGLAGMLHLAPALALLASVGVGIVVGGPGVLAFPIPALLWCALTYSLFTTTVLTMALSTWLLISLPAQMIPLSYLPNPIRLLDSIRLGVALMALGPLTVASTNTARKELIDKLSHQANHDSLTGALSRGAFMRRGEAKLRQLSRTSRNAALLMLDIDHFKRINDRLGHAAGDKALQEFFRVVSSVLREDDLFGRTGGEEFAALLPRTDPIEAAAIAERIRLAVETARITVASGERLRLTVSIGVAAQAAAKVAHFDDLLLAADRALYEAKAAGRNTVRIGAQQLQDAA